MTRESHVLRDFCEGTLSSRMGSHDKLQRLFVGSLHLTPRVPLIHEGRRILGLKKYQSRNPHGYFQDLSWEAQRRARNWLWLWCQKWGSFLTLRANARARFSIQR